jgi:capsular polysaccharide biosynthesis protein
LQLLRQKLEPDPSAKWRSHWVCFSRDLHRNTEAPQGRTFSNYPKLLESLSNAGVLIVDPGQHDIRQMQLLVAGAKGFVGIHGAGLFNALLGEEGAKIIEIRPACGCWRDLELTCKVAKLDWTAVMCDPDISNPEQSVIPIATVLDLIG